MILTDVAMVAVVSNRTRAYLQRMIHLGLAPAHVALMHPADESPLPYAPLSTGAPPTSPVRTDTEFILRLGESVTETLQAGQVPYTLIPTTDINSPVIRTFLTSRPESVWIYSGAGGAILREEVLSIGKRFLHVHPGIVPQYRGSTTIYYSLLREGTVGASAIFLASQIDAGPLLATKSFPPPTDRKTIDYAYDPLVRSELLLEVLDRYVKEGEFSTTPQQKEGGMDYFIIHPVLKHLCILGGH